MGWRQLILNNLGWKVAALLLATAVWFTMKSGEPVEIHAHGLFTSTRVLVGLPVQKLQSPDDPRNFRVKPTEVNVTVSGEIPVLEKLDPADIHPFVAITTLVTNSVSTNKLQIQAPPGIKLEKANPESVQLELIQPGAKVEFRGPDGLSHVTNVFDFAQLPIRVLQSPEDRRRFKVDPETVNVRVSGDAAILEKLSGKDIMAFVDVTSTPDAGSTNRVEISAPPGVRMEKASPALVQVKLAAAEAKEPKDLKDTKETKPKAP